MDRHGDRLGFALPSLLCAGHALAVHSGCASTAHIEERYRSQAAQISKSYEDADARVYQQYLQAVEELSGLRAEIVPLAPESNLPITTVWESDGIDVASAACEQIDPTVAESPARNQCLESVFTEKYLPLLDRRYPYAGLEYALSKWAEAEYAYPIEAVFAAIHNLAIEDFVARKRGELEAELQAARASLRASRDELMQQALDSRTAAIAEENRRAAAIWAAALQGAGTAMQRSFARSRTPAQLGPVAPGCSSDYACRIGERCVKNNFASSGVCMKVVDSMGLPQYEMPNPNSIAPKLPSRNDCLFDSQCPIGFRCDQGSGVCVKR